MKLDSIGRNLNRLAEAGELEEAIGRNAEIGALCQVLSADGKNSAVLVGPPGVGKTAIVEGLALRLVRGEVPKALKGREIVEINHNALVAGTKYRGELEERMHGLLAEARKNRKLILFIDEIHNIMGGRASQSDSLAEVMKPALARGELTLIGATTTDEYRKYIEPDGACARRLIKVEVGELSPDATREVLRRLARRFEREHGVAIADDAVDFLVDASVRYIPDRCLPDKAIDLLRQLFSSAEQARAGGERSRTLDGHFALLAEEVAAVKRGDFATALRKLGEYLEARQADGFRILTRADAARLVSSRVGVPITEGMQDEFRTRVLGLEAVLRRRVRGQDLAVATVASAVRRMAAGLKRPEKPAGSFLYVGPTGVGKTELARQLACHLFGSTSRLIRIDMSEYMEEHSLSRLIGAPPGYVGHDEGGQLTDAIRQQPFSVVLFDEVEKAHPRIQHIFLQMLEEGVLTDGQGRKALFNNAIIIMTSNEGAEDLARFTPAQLAEHQAEVREALLTRLSRRFRPEVLGRIDDIVLFAPLGMPELVEIFTAMVAEYAELVRRSHGITLEVTELALHQLVQRGYDPALGARPLRHTLEAEVITPLSDQILTGVFKAGDVVRVDWEQGVVFRGV